MPPRSRGGSGGANKRAADRAPAGGPDDQAAAASSNNDPPSAPSSSSQPRRGLKFQPRASARRSREDRDAIVAAENARVQERLAVAEAEKKKNAAAHRNFRDNPAGGGGGGGPSSRGGRSARGRGGYMGDSFTSGPFSSGLVAGGGTRRHATGSRGLKSHGTSLGGHTIKREGKIKSDVDGDMDMLGLNLKQEPTEGGYISSDPDNENEHEGPRQDIDYINLVSDDEQEAEGGGGGFGGGGGVSIPAAGLARQDSGLRLNSQSLAPVRILRREHTDRNVGFSPLAPAKKEEQSLREEGRKARQRGPDNIAGPAANRLLQMGTGAGNRKGGSRARDVEVIGSEKVWKGVYEDEDGLAESPVKVKQEPLDDDDDGEGSGPEDMSQMPVDSHNPITSPRGNEKDSKTRNPQRRLSFQRDAKAVLQTDEDRQEWARHDAALQILRDELGSVELTQKPAVDTAMAHAESDAGATLNDPVDFPDKKADRVYLFQLPPVIPALHLEAVEAAQSAPPASGTANDSTTGAARAGGPQPTPHSQPQHAIKTEDGGRPDGAHPQSLWPKLEPGRVGKLRVYESGRATLSWGGTSLQLNMGTDVHFLQDSVLTRMAPGTTPAAAPTAAAAATSAAEPPEPGGEAMAFGPIRGKFVVTPDWSEILG